MIKDVDGSVAVFALIMLGFIIGMFLFGYTSPAISWLEFDEAFDSDGEFHYEEWNIDAGDFLANMVDYMKSSLGVGAIATSVIVAILIGFSGTGQMGATVLSFAIPALLISMVANIFFFPIVDFANGEGLAFPLNFILLAVYNVLLLLVMITFVSGRD